MKPTEKLSTESGVLAVAYSLPTHRTLVEVCDAEYRTTVETLLPRQRKPGPRPHTEFEYDAALAGLGYSRTSTWRLRGALAFCDVTTAHT